MEKRKATIGDIARRAGVGRATVSRVLNDQPNVSAEVREKVRRIVDELDYRPRSAARHLRTQRSHLIGFIGDQVATTPYAGALIQGAQEAAWESGQLLMVVDAGVNTAITAAAVDALLDREVEGIIYAEMYHRPVRLPEKVREVPTVLVNCYAVDRRLPSVVPNEIAGGRRATETLISRGHRRIGFININTLDPGIPASVGRQQGYREALAAHDLSYDEALVHYGMGDPESGYRYMQELMRLPDPPSAVFCGNDRTAMGAYSALHELGLRIPRDVAVIGFDNQEIIAAALRPALTTMQLPHYEMGRWAVDYITQKANSAYGTHPIQYLLDCPLIERESV